MTTKNPGINVTFEEATAALLARLVNQEHKSVSSFVRELSLEALEMREDRYLSTVAEELDQVGTKIYSHEEAWK